MLLNIITRDVWYVSVNQGCNSYSYNYILKTMCPLYALADFKLKKELKSLSALPLVLLFELTCFFVLGYCVIL